MVPGVLAAVTVQIDEYVFELRRKENLPLLYFRDITRQANAEKHYSEERLVIGMACFDNYEESTQFEDESDVANINNAVLGKQKTAYGYRWVKAIDYQQPHKV